VTISTFREGSHDLCCLFLLTVILLIFSLLTRRAPRSTLFPYTTLFRSQVEVVAECNDGFEGAKAIMQYQPDIVFLDIQMKTISRSEEHTSELQSRENLVCRLLLEKKKKNQDDTETNSNTKLRNTYLPKE